MDLSTDNDSIRHYCRHHKLSRPAINWSLIIYVVLAFEVLLCLCAYLLSLSTSSFFLLIDIVHFAAFFLFGRKILSLVVQIYQRYAPESLRRQCTCKPTCSEYALLALQKYNWPKALYLIIRRVTRTCQQPGYKIDFP